MPLEKIEMRGRQVERSRLGAHRRFPVKDQTSIFRVDSPNETRTDGSHNDVIPC